MVASLSLEKAEAEGGEDRQDIAEERREDAKKAAEYWCDDGEDGLNKRHDELAKGKLIG